MRLVRGTTRTAAGMARGWRGRRASRVAAVLFLGTLTGAVPFFIPAGEDGHTAQLCDTNKRSALYLPAAAAAAKNMSDRGRVLFALLFRWAWNCARRHLHAGELRLYERVPRRQAPMRCSAVLLLQGVRSRHDVHSTL